MTERVPATPAPGPLEDYAQAFDDLFSKHNQRDSFHRYLEGLLLPMERNKTLTGLANTEPVVGAQQRSAQRLQWFLSESTWDPAVVNRRRVQFLQQRGHTAAHEQGVLAIDETGDRKWGEKTAHVGRQYLGSLGKVENGVVSVHILWADERVYYPLQAEPYTPAGWFERGRQDSDFRAKPEIALELVKEAVAAGMPFPEGEASGEKTGRSHAPPLNSELAHGVTPGAGVVGALPHAASLLAGVVGQTPHPHRCRRCLTGCRKANHSTSMSGDNKLPLIPPNLLVYPHQVSAQHLADVVIGHSPLDQPICQSL